MNTNLIIETADKLYRDANPGGRKDTPSFIYEAVEGYWIKYQTSKYKDDYDFYGWCVARRDGVIDPE